MKIVIMLLLFSSCRDGKNLINIEQIESDKFPVVIAYDAKTKNVSIVNFPLVFSISLNRRKMVKISDPAYYCNSNNQKMISIFGKVV